MLLIILRLR